ncbi:MAG TPA: hypothetical protein VHU80_22980 [Polyangiaceae bacterium]|jgi:hypothetical protein|nr:hypothetical protein [Polyangiaceae bacterium]
MKTRCIVVALAAGLSSAGSFPSEAGAKESDCVGVSSQAVYRNYGYDHIVHLTNRCDEAAACDVSTDVNPEPIHATVPASGETDVLTFRGSPARAFTPHVHCHSVR